MYYGIWENSIAVPKVGGWSADEMSMVFSAFLKFVLSIYKMFLFGMNISPRNGVPFWRVLSADINSLSADQHK